MVHHKVCPLCKSEKISIPFSCTDNFISKEVFQLARCGNCGFEFTQDAPEENEIGRYYESDDYISHSGTKKGFSNKLYHLARNFMLWRKSRIVGKFTGLKSGRLLDIGSGTGHFADKMKRSGWDVKGVEINEKARSFSVSQFGLDIIDPEKISVLKSESFDCITLWHVLEHFHDPFKYASEIHRMLKPDGICIIALPNSGSFDARHYGKFWAAYDMPRHLWHFNSSTFRTFAGKTGFMTVKILTLPLDLFYISILSEKYTGSGMPFFEGIVVAKMYTFASFFKKERCSSLIYILRKL
jgi:2-polyprenyl-3-methyl-5-hydroxy-6-metoxy-1,4-benzoquinol methylase